MLPRNHMQSATDRKFQAKNRNKMERSQHSAKQQLQLITTEQTLPAAQQNSKSLRLHAALPSSVILLSLVCVSLSCTEYFAKIVFKSQPEYRQNHQVLVSVRRSVNKRRNFIPTKCTSCIVLVCNLHQKRAKNPHWPSLFNLFHFHVAGMGNWEVPGSL
jgi:hypothetical protein